MHKTNVCLALNWPARYNTVIAVGSIDDDDQLSSFSNHGTGIELVAPGRRIISTTMDNGYEFFTGTSMATTHVAGVAALAFLPNDVIAPSLL